MVLTLRLKTKGKATAIIAREITLDIAFACYAPSVAEHVPGIANATCDMLSRKFQPGKAYRLPDCLAGVTEEVLDQRCALYFRSLAQPPGSR